MCINWKTNKVGINPNPIVAVAALQIDISKNVFDKCK
jgi:hypothetical protein